jgi:L-amino acid N-acyltransferase YncA
MENIAIKPMTKESWPQVARIYESGITTGNATFQTEVPDWESWDSAHRRDCRLIAMIDDKIVGWAALSPVSGRCVYSGVAEVSIYVDSVYRGKGVGTRLIESLIKESEQSGIWTLQSGVFPENKESLSLHQKNGFRIIGTRKKIGKMDNRWRDVILLERRSDSVGID